MPIISGIEIDVARADIAKKVSRLSRADVFGLGCKDKWSDVMARYIISDMFLCTGGVNLGKCDKDCLTGKMTKGLNNCC